MHRTQRQLGVAGLLCSLSAGVAMAAPAEPRFRHSAPITVQQSAAFVQLPLPPAAYGHSQRAGLEDLRIIDAKGERVPFTLLPPRAAKAEDNDLQHDAVLYPLPRRPADGKAWPSPVEVVVQGERISVRRIGGAGNISAATTPPTASPGWLIDLGERKPDAPAPTSLRMQWSGPSEFSVAFAFETSDDLRSWRAGGRGQLMALATAQGALTQPTVVLPAGAGRFVRLVWFDPAAAPTLSGVTVIAARQRSVVLDPPTELTFSAGPEPAGKTAPDAASARALHFDLGGALPLMQVDLQLAPGTRVAPVRVQGRQRVDEPWRDLTQAVFYRLERDGSVSTSPPVALRAAMRYLRVLPDERSAPLDATQTRLAVQAQLASLVFASQGVAPYTLLAGASDAPTSALPASTLIPTLEDERPRFGKATLGEWSEVAAVARQVEAEQRQAALRPWLLWAVLLAGVAGLGFMVWRLARGRNAGAPTPQ